MSIKLGRSGEGVSEKGLFLHSVAVFVSFAGAWKRKENGCYAGQLMALPRGGGMLKF